MRFTRFGDFDVVTQVAGPIHHYLGLSLSQDANPRAPEVEELSLSVQADSLGVRPVRAKVIEEVFNGLDAVNHRLGTSYKVKAIRYCASDPMIDGAYTSLTESLVEHVDLLKVLRENIASDSDQMSIPDWHIEELERREEFQSRNPRVGSPWDEVKARIRQDHGD